MDSRRSGSRRLVLQAHLRWPTNAGQAPEIGVECSRPLEKCSAALKLLAEQGIPGKRKPFRVADLLLVLCPNGFGQGDHSGPRLRLKNHKAGKMTKPHHKLKKANHGARPANAKARKAKRKKVRT